MQPRCNYRSPHFDDRPIPVEFVLLHYTACNLPASLACFFDASRPVSCHLLLAEDGECYELVECWEGTCKRAWHAGQSRYTAQGSHYTAFNDFAIGIEIVNVNGNLLPYTDAQYAALSEILLHLQTIYPSLQDPARVLGHEDVAAWRGKADPGRCFDWPRLFAMSYPGLPPPQRRAVCPQSLAAALARFLPVVPAAPEDATRFWHALSATTEAAVELAFATPPAGWTV